MGSLTDEPITHRLLEFKNSIINERGRDSSIMSEIKSTPCNIYCFAEADVNPHNHTFEGRAGFIIDSLSHMPDSNYHTFTFSQIAFFKATLLCIIKAQEYLIANSIKGKVVINSISSYLMDVLNMECMCFEHELFYSLNRIWELNRILKADFVYNVDSVEFMRMHIEFSKYFGNITESEYKKKLYRIRQIA